MKHLLTAAFAAFIVFVFGLEAVAQDRMTLTKIQSPVILDGIIDEPAWDQIEPLDLVQYEPVFRGVMNEQTELKVGYDEDYIYVAGKMFTKDPESITNNSLTRDNYSGDDVFAIVLDPFNDNENALWFFTTPSGVRVDIAISNDANFGGGSSAMNPSWNTFWDAATTITDEGWFAEMRIPFSSIGFQENEGIAEMGMIVYRWIASANERHIFPAIEPNWGLGNAKPSQAQDVVLEGVQSKSPIYVTPYILGGRTNSAEFNADSSAYRTDSNFEREIGLDLKYNLNSNLTLDLTLNTDFAQVEADDQQLNLSRFSLFFPEKRQFFQERAGLFNVSLGRNRLFYSRRIGLDDDGNPVRILGGARMSGKIGAWNVGLINMQTADSETLPSENFGVVRLQRNTFNDQSTAGALVTTRVGSDGSSNYLYAFDSRTNMLNDHFLEVYASQTISSEIASENRMNLDSTGVARISFTKENSIGFNYRFVVARYGENFDPGIGFAPRTGNIDTFGRFAYGWFAPENSAINRQEIDLTIFRQGDKNNIKDVFTMFISSEWNIRFKRAGEFGIDAEFSREALYEDEDFDLLDRFYIPTGEYDTFFGGMYYRSAEGRDFQFGINAGYGSIYDGTTFDFGFEPQWNVSTNLEIGGNYTLTSLYFPDSPERNISEFTAHLTQFRARYAFNKKASASTFVQFSNVDELMGMNFRFRYNFSEGRDLWFVFNEQLNTDRNQVDLPRLPVSDSSTLLIKYTHTFIF